MLKFLKFLLGFFSLILLIILLNISFFGKEINKQENLSIFDEVSYSGTLNNKINFLDNIFTKNKEDFNIQDTDNKIKINLKKGIFILNLNDLTKKYSIYGDGFEIDLKSTGDLFINNLGTNITIISFDSSILIKFLDKNGKIINSYINYPHEYIKFDTKLNYIYKGVDLFRIRTTTKNGYIKNKENFHFIVGKNNALLVNKYLDFKEKLYINNEKNYKKLNELNYSNFPFSQYINKYKKYFINNSKKSVYIQSNIYNNIIKLFNADFINSNLIIEINNSLNDLKKLDINKYNESLNFINNFYRVILLKNDIYNYKKTENFTLLKDNNSYFLKLKNYEGLKNIYFNHDYLNKKIFKKLFIKYLNNFLNNIGINEEVEDFEFNSSEKIFEIESFVFFMQEYIEYHLFIDDIDNFGTEVDILKRYVKFIKMIYFSRKTDSIKIETSLKQNIKLLTKLEKYLRYKFFNQQRDRSSKLLIFKNKNIVKFEDIKELEIQINIILSLFDNSKNKVFLDEYKNLKAKFTEEFLAINDYENYKINYDLELKELYHLRGLGEEVSKLYNIDDIYNYLSKFNGITFDKKNIFKEKNHFIIKNVYINNISYNFVLYPNLGNKVDILKLKENDSKKFSYNLDEIKRLFDEKIKGTKQEDKYKYDFHNFFKEKFKDIKIITKNLDPKEICRLKNMVINSNGICVIPNIDSDAISVFKKNKLLKEEFNVINDYFLIKYDNISVKSNSGIYKIKILDTITNIDIKKSNNIKKRYELILNADYDFKNHLFYNVFYKISLKDKKEKYLFDGSYFYIKHKKISINDLKMILENKFQNIDIYKNIYSTLRGNFVLNNFKIEDVFGKTYLKFDINSKKVIIKVEKNQISSIIVGDINILENSIDINDLRNYIDKIK